MFNKKGWKIILASKSPRRKQLLQDAGLIFEVDCLEVEENYPAGLEVEKIAEYLACLKAVGNASLLDDKTILISADTIVCMDGKVYGKPENLQEAKAFIKELLGKTHEVITGVCLKTKTKQKSFSVVSKVRFKKLSSQEINHYVEECKPLDKAGAYAIQEWIGLIGITEIEGSYTNIVGLPVSNLLEELANFYNDL